MNQKFLSDTDHGNIFDWPERTCLAIKKALSVITQPNTNRFARKNGKSEKFKNFNFQNYESMELKHHIIIGLTTFGLGLLYFGYTNYLRLAFKIGQLVGQLHLSHMMGPHTLGCLDFEFSFVCQFCQIRKFWKTSFLAKNFRNPMFCQNLKFWNFWRK